MLGLVALSDKMSSYHELLFKESKDISNNRRLHKVLIVVFKSLFVSTYPEYLKELFVLRNLSYSLRGKNILALHQEQQSYGLDCIRYQPAKMWNSLSVFTRAITSLKDFKIAHVEDEFSVS